MAETAIFYIMAALILFSAWRVVTVSNLFHGAVWLVGVLFGIAGMYLLIDAQFLSAVQVTIYVGGIVVLIVFAVLLVSDVTQKVHPESSAGRRGLVGVVVAIMTALIIGSMLAFDFGRGGETALRSASIREIGVAMLSPKKGGFILPFEAISLLLIAALVGALTIARADPSPGTAPREGPP